MNYPRVALAIVLALSLSIPLPMFAGEAYDVEDFRNNVLTMIDEIEKALDGATRDPVIGPDVSRILVANGMTLPFPDSIREAVKNATTEEMARAQREFTVLPAMFEVPGLIDEALRELHSDDESARAAGLCETNYDAFTAFKGKRTAIRGVNTTADIFGITLRVTNMIKTINGAATEDLPYSGRIPSIPLIVLVGVQDIVIKVLSLVAGAVGTSKDEDELSIDACCIDPVESQSLAGRGCDNRDNNCDGTIDEAGEDLYFPTLEVDSSVLDRCYPSRSAAEDAVKFSVTAHDDCSDQTPSFQFDLAGCTGTATFQVSDLKPNTTIADPFFVTVDDQAPDLAVPQLQACYATIGDARNAIEQTVVTDCTDTLVDVSAVPSECAAQLSVAAEDECGNRSEFIDDVVVDGTPPAVDINKLLLPSVDGRFCFDSTASAVAAVEDAASIADNCTPLAELNLSTTAVGPTCGMTVTRSAADGCGRLGEDSLPVRIDSTPPEVACTVDTPTLWPADGSMIDVGFNMTVTDDCDPLGELDITVTVTSDEPTALARETLGGDDPSPDAELVYGGNGNVQRILLRAERSDYGPADGRIYRIRVVATDSCGFSTQSDCWVDVPRELSRGQGINSGQKYRADRRN